MGWTIDYADAALKELRKLDKQQAQRIVKYLDTRVLQGDPREQGKALSGPLGTLWRYRVGDFRIICHLEDGLLRVLVVKVGHRKEVYR